MSEFLKNRGIDNVDPGVNAVPVLRLTQSAPVIIRHSKRKDTENKMHAGIIFDNRRDGRTHAAEVMVIDTEYDMKRRLHGLGPTSKSFIVSSATYKFLVNFGDLTKPP
jgi:hypothetical protein